MTLIIDENVLVMLSHRHSRMGKNCWDRRAAERIKISCLPRDSPLSFVTLMNTSTANKEIYEIYQKAIHWNSGLVFNPSCTLEIYSKDSPLLYFTNTQKYHIYFLYILSLTHPNSQNVFSVFSCDSDASTYLQVETSSKYVSQFSDLSEGEITSKQNTPGPSCSRAN